MALKLRGDTWWYEFRIKGKRYRGSCLTKDEQQAKEFHDLTKASIWRARALKEPERHTVNEAIERFESLSENKRSYADDKRYAAWWKEKFASAGIKMLDDVTPDAVDEIVRTELTRVTRRGRNPTPATVNRKIAFLRAMVNMASREWLWMERAPLFRLLPGEVERHRFLRPDEVIRLVKALPEPYGDMALFAVSTGLRQSNVFRLKWSNVDLAQRKITFPQEVMKNGLPFSCPMTDTAVAVVRGWVGRHDEYVFVTKNGPVTWLNRAVWLDALEKSGLQNLRWHDLRHTWASLMRQSGVGLADLQELGGWRSQNMVQRYAHMNVDHLREAASRMDGILGGRVGHRLATAA